MWTLPTTDKAPTYDNFQQVKDPGKNAGDYFQPYWYANDRDGSGAHHIQAHGGSMTKSGDTWYWVGESHEHGYGNSPGIHMYSSKDLYNWKDEGIVLKTVSKKTDLNDTYFQNLYDLKTHPDRADKVFPYLNTNNDQDGNGKADSLAAIMERPKLLHNPKTGKWIIWFHSDGSTSVGGSNYSRAMLGVAVSDTPTGPYRLIGAYKGFSDGTKPGWGEKGDSRDMTAFAAKDGHAYLGYSSEGNVATYVARLDDSWTHLDKTVTTDRSGSKMQYSEDGRYTDIEGGKAGTDYRVITRDRREATAFLQHGGDTYAITSATTGWDPNEQNYYQSKDGNMLGEWTSKGKLIRTGDTHRSTFGSQVASIIPYDESRGEYIYLGDRWHSGAADSTYVVLPIALRWDRTLELVNPNKAWNLDWWADTGVAWRDDRDLQAAIDKAGRLNASQYTGDSWARVTSAVNTVKGLKGTNAGQQAIWDAISGVNHAIDALVYNDTTPISLDCKTSGDKATGPEADDYCWIDWSGLDFGKWNYSKSHPVTVTLPGGTLSANLTLTKSDLAELAAKGSERYHLSQAYDMGDSKISLTMEALQASDGTWWHDRSASASFTDITVKPDAHHTISGWGMLFGDSEVMSWNKTDHSQYEETSIESDKPLKEVGLVGDTNPAHSYQGGVTRTGNRITLKGGWDGNTVDGGGNVDSAGAMIVSSDQPSRFTVDFSHHNRNGWSAIAVGVKAPGMKAAAVKPASLTMPAATKVWHANGSTRKITDFRFGLYPNAGATGTPVQTVNANASGRVVFQPVSFDASAFKDGVNTADVTWSIKELTDGTDGMAWDTHVMTIPVHLTRSYDDASNTTTITAEAGAPGGSTTFTNTWRPKVTALPGTGHRLSVIVPLVAVGLGVTGLGVGIARHVRRRDR